MHVDWQKFGDMLLAALSSNGAPAWIQAMGALLALWVAVRVPIYSVKHAASVKRQTIFAIAEAAHTHACNIRSAIDAMDWKTGNNTQIYSVYHKVVIESVVKALQGVPMHEIGSSRGGLAILSLTEQMVFLSGAVETLLLGPIKHPEIAKTLESVDPNETERRQTLFATGFSVLQNNVRVHLNKIDKDYNTLSELLNP